MECCTHCAETDEFFDEQTAREELRDDRRDGFSKSPGRLLAEGLESLDLEGTTLLDAGGGIGAIPFDRLDDGIARSTLVEASNPYLEVAEHEARQRGLDDRMVWATAISSRWLRTASPFVPTHPERSRPRGGSARSEMIPH